MFYTAPTLIRSLEAADVKYVRQHDRSSLAVLGTVGEPINLAAWQWYHEVGCCGPQKDVVSLWRASCIAAHLTRMSNLHHKVGWKCFANDFEAPAARESATPVPDSGVMRWVPLIDVVQYCSQ